MSCCYFEFFFSAPSFSTMSGDTRHLFRSLLCLLQTERQLAKLNRCNFCSRLFIGVRSELRISGPPEKHERLKENAEGRNAFCVP